MQTFLPFNQKAVYFIPLGPGDFCISKDRVECWHIRPLLSDVLRRSYPCTYASSQDDKYGSYPGRKVLRGEWEGSHLCMWPHYSH